MNTSEGWKQHRKFKLFTSYTNEFRMARNALGGDHTMFDFTQSPTVHPSTQTRATLSAVTHEQCVIQSALIDHTV